MKNIILTGILLCAAVFSCQLNAQVKKAVAKPKATTSAAKGPVFNKIDFFALAPDDAVQILNDEFKKIRIVLNDIREEPTYYYVSGKKTTLQSTFRRLDFGSDFSANITSDERDQITDVSFSLSSGALKHIKNIKKMLGYSSWPAISVTDLDTTYRSGNMIANSSGFINRNDAGKIVGHSVDITVKKIRPYTYVSKSPKQFDPQNLSVHDNDLDMGYSIVDLMKRLGINLLYRDAEMPVLGDDDKLLGYSCVYYFDKSVWVSVNTSAMRRPDRIYMQCQDPITFSKLKKSLGILQWPEGKGDEEDDSSDYYEYKNVVSSIHSPSKGISISISPLPEDVATRLEYTSAPTFDELLELYKSGTPEEVVKTFTNSYVTMVEYDASGNLVPNSSADKFTFFYKTPNNMTARCTFNYDRPTFQKGTEIYVGSSDIAYMQVLMSQYQKNGAKHYYQINMKGAAAKYPGDFDQIWFLNKAVYDVEAAKTLAEKQQKEAELARVKEKERQEAIAREKERAARSAETLNKLGEFIKNYGKKQ